MQGTWNAVIKTPFVQLYALFLIKVEQSGNVQITLSTEPMNLGLSFDNIQVGEPSSGKRNRR